MVIKRDGIQVTLLADHNGALFYRILELGSFPRAYGVLNWFRYTGVLYMYVRVLDRELRFGLKIRLMGGSMQPGIRLDAAACCVLERSGQWESGKDGIYRKIQTLVIVITYWSIKSTFLHIGWSPDASTVSTRRFEMKQAIRHPVPGTTTEPAGCG